MTAGQVADPHAQAREQMSAYLDGELEGGARAALEGHVAGCAPCREELERLRATVGKLGALRLRAPATFLPDIQKQIYQRSKGRFFNRRLLLFGRIPFEWISLVMIVAMLAYYLVTLHGAPTSVSPGP